MWSWLSVLGVPSGELREATQAVFPVMWDEFEEFRSAPSERAWLFARAVDVARQRRTDGSEARSSEDGATVPLASILAPWAERERVILLLFEVGGLPVEQIAELLGEVPSHVLERLCQVRAGEPFGVDAQALPLRRLLSPTMRISKELRAVLQAALPVLPTPCDAESVERALLAVMCEHERQDRPSGILSRVKRS